MTELPHKGYKQWIEILQIFDKYQPDESYVLQPDHDVIHTGCSPELVSEEDKKRLAELGCEPDEDFDCFYVFT